METEVQKAAEDANNAALSAAQSAEDNRNTALHTLETRPAIWTGSGYDVVTEF